MAVLFLVSPFVAIDTRDLLSNRTHRPTAGKDADFLIESAAHRGFLVVSCHPLLWVRVFSLHLQY